MPTSRRAKKWRQRRKTRKQRRLRRLRQRTRKGIQGLRITIPNNNNANNKGPSQSPLLGQNNENNNNANNNEEVSQDPFIRPYQLLPKEFPFFTNDFYQYFYYDDELRKEYFEDKVVLDVGTRDTSGMLAMCKLGAREVIGIDPDDRQFNKIDDYLEMIETEYPCELPDPMKLTLQEFQAKYPKYRTENGDAIQTICILLWNIPVPEYFDFMRALVKLCDRETAVIVSFVDAEYHIVGYTHPEWKSYQSTSVENLFSKFFYRVSVTYLNDFMDPSDRERMEGILTPLPDDPFEYEERKPTYRLCQSILIASHPK